MRPLPLPTDSRELNAQVVAARGDKAEVSADRPYLYFVEPECNRDGVVEDVATIFLTNRECPLRCTMCDLWRHTLDETVPAGAITQQIEFAFREMRSAPHVKLYNSGNFFDRLAIPTSEHESIAALVAEHRTVIVENHPKFCGPVCFEFQKQLQGQLEIAMGLETVHEPTLKSLNKSMTLDDFRRACGTLLGEDIALRAFLMLKPPGMNEAEGIEWTIRSLEFAFDRGVSTCSIIPTRSGNGIMEQLEAEGFFSPPTLRSLEAVQAAGIGMNRGRVFVDLWDVEKFSACSACFADRERRLDEMNLRQVVLPDIVCDRCG